MSFHSFLPLCSNGLGKNLGSASCRSVKNLSAFSIPPMRSLAKTNWPQKNKDRSFSKGDHSVKTGADGGSKDLKNKKDFSTFEKKKPFPSSSPVQRSGSVSAPQGHQKGSTDTQSPISVPVKETKPKSALMMAIEAKDSSILELLIESGADINEVDHNGINALFVALNEKDINTARILIEKGINLDHQDTKGWTALMSSIGHQCKEIIDLLIEKGTDLNLSTKEGSNALFVALAKKDIETSKILIEKGINLDHQDTKGWTALMTSINNECKEITDLLIEKGANLNLINKDGSTAIILAIKKVDKETVKKLLQYGAKP